MIKECILLKKGNIIYKYYIIKWELAKQLVVQKTVNSRPSRNLRLTFKKVILIIMLVQKLSRLHRKSTTCKAMADRNLKLTMNKNKINHTNRHLLRKMPKSHKAASSL